MPKLKNQPPKICRIKSNNAAVVKVPPRVRPVPRRMDERRSQGNRPCRKKGRFHLFLSLQSRRLVSRQAAPTHTRRRVRPQALVAVREQMEQSGRFSRTYINDLISRTRSIFKWGVGQEMVLESTARAIGKDYVQPLREGKTTAPETEPREDRPRRSRRPHPALPLSHRRRNGASPAVGRHEAQRSLPNDGWRHRSEPEIFGR